MSPAEQMKTLPVTPAAKKVIRQKLSALERAQTLGNIAEACRRRGISRTIFY